MGDRARVPRPPPPPPPPRIAGSSRLLGAAQRLARGICTKLCDFWEFSPDKHPETRPDKHPEYVQVGCDGSSLRRAA